MWESPSRSTVDDASCSLPGCLVPSRQSCGWFVGWPGGMAECVCVSEWDLNFCRSSTKFQMKLWRRCGSNEGRGSRQINNLRITPRTYAA